METNIVEVENFLQQSEERRGSAFYAGSETLPGARCRIRNMLMFYLPI
ncbi:hypothetical protein ACLK1T_29125 [Escherichia coli]